MVSYIKGESRLRVLENRILRRIFGPKRGANGRWRRLHNEELHSLYRSPNIVRVIKYRTLKLANKAMIITQKPDSTLFVVKFHSK